jgi:hypothetical protein
MAEAIMERPIPTGEGLTYEQIMAMFREDREKLKENDRILKETQRIVKQNSKQIGGLHNKFGQLAEHLVAPGIVKRFNEIGYHFDLVSKKDGEIHDATGKTLTQIDILMENEKIVIAVEVKVRPDLKDIGHHIKRIEIMKNSLLGRNRKVLGAIAGAIFEDTVKEETNKAGFFVIVQSGDTMKIEMPEGFVPKEW